MTCTTNGQLPTPPQPVDHEHTFRIRSRPVIGEVHPLRDDQPRDALQLVLICAPEVPRRADVDLPCGRVPSADARTLERRVDYASIGAKLPCGFCPIGGLLSLRVQT